MRGQKIRLKDGTILENRRVAKVEAKTELAELNGEYRYCDTQRGQIKHRNTYYLVRRVKRFSDSWPDVWEQWTDGYKPESCLKCAFKMRLVDAVDSAVVEWLRGAVVDAVRAAEENNRRPGAKWRAVNVEVISWHLHHPELWAEDDVDTLYVPASDKAKELRKSAKEAGDYLHISRGYMWGDVVNIAGPGAKQLILSAVEWNIRRGHLGRYADRGGFYIPEED